MDCKQGTNLIIEQMIELLEKINPENYSKPLQLFNGSSIGQHFRHILDFYTCLCNGIADERIDYAKRERDVYIETNPQYAIEIFKKILTVTCELQEQDTIEVVADFSSDLNTERPVVKTTVARELMYAYDHAVHHLAMIKMGLKVVSPNLEINKNIGVAPSTVKHWNTANSSSSS
ncbi:MAG: hypothetical protein R2825_08105 [Saprospiraceae bacterium]